MAATTASSSPSLDEAARLLHLGKATVTRAFAELEAMIHPQDSASLAGGKWGGNHLRCRTGR